MKNLKFVLFPTYVPVTLIMFKLQIHPTNSEIHYEALVNKELIKIQNLSLTH